jgi:hypothetical protein
LSKASASAPIKAATRRLSSVLAEGEVIVAFDFGRLLEHPATNIDPPWARGEEAHVHLSDRALYVIQAGGAAVRVPNDAIAAVTCTKRRLSIALHGGESIVIAIATARAAMPSAWQRVPGP